MESALVECQWLRARRELLGLTQDQCAAAVGVTRQAWNGWEVGDWCPSRRRIVLLAEVLGMSVRECIEQVAAWRAVLSKLRAAEYCREALDAAQEHIATAQSDDAASTDQDQIRVVIGYIWAIPREKVDHCNSRAIQRRRIKGWAASKGWPVAAIYCDVAESDESASNWPQLSRAIKHSCDSRGVLVSCRLDRWAHSVADAGTIVERLKAAGAGLVSIDEAFDTTASTGSLVVNILTALAQLAHDRTEAGMNILRARGMQRGGAVPYGYVCYGDLIVPCEVEQQTIGWMKAMRAAGSKYSAIASALNASHTPSKRGGKWRQQAVEGVLEGAAMQARRTQK